MTFHPDAVKKYQQDAEELLREVQVLRDNTKSPGRLRRDIHIAHEFTSDEIIEMPDFCLTVDALGAPSEFRWNSEGTIVGWTGDAFKRIKDLAERMSRKGPAKERISDVFALEVTCTWLREKLEFRQRNSLPAYFVECCKGAIQKYEIWIPLFRTYASKEFRIGKVAFRTVSKDLMDELQQRASRSMGMAEATAIGNKMRTKWQGTLAACSCVEAERRKASELARAAAKNATALLSFLSPSNWSSHLTNFNVLLGSEAFGSTAELIIREGVISEVREHVNDPREPDWFIDRTPRGCAWILPALHELASNLSTPYRFSLYSALLLYARQAQASELSDKLLFALSALESIFLRDSSEPIQKNLGERIAFLIGETIEQRKAIVKNVTQIYKIRSAFVHHGATPEHQEVLDEFLITAWSTFAKLLELRDRYRTKEVLLSELEDRKMS